MSDHEDNFDNAGSGASQTFPKQCSALRKNEHVVIKGRPCKIVEMSTSKTGKHGHAKVHMVGIDIFTGKKLEDICPSTHNMDCPNVKKTEFILMDIDNEGYVSMMDQETNEERTDLKVPEGDIGTALKDAFAKDEQGIMVLVVAAMGEECIMGHKNMPK